MRQVTTVYGTMHNMKYALHRTPVKNNTLKVEQMEVLKLNVQYVTYLRLQALDHTMRAILKECLKIVAKRDIPKVAELCIIHISFM